MVRSAQCASRLYRALCRCQLYHSHNSYLYCILYFVFHYLYFVFCIGIYGKRTVCILGLQSAVSLSALSQSQQLFVFVLYFVFYDLYSVFCICISEKCRVCILALQSTVSLSALSQSQQLFVFVLYFVFCIS